MKVRDFFHEREPQSVSFFLEVVLPKIPVEYIFEVLLFYPDPLILYDEDSVFKYDLDCSAIVRVLDGIFEDISHADVKVLSVDGDCPALFMEGFS